MSNAAETQQQTPPAIGQAWPAKGGIYAGLARGRDGSPDYHLIVGPDLGRATWPKAGEAAAAVTQDDLSDFTLPLRAEQALMFANVPELFGPHWYWSCEQHASDSDCAWMQYFGNGHQSYYRKGTTDRARAVRRLKIFDNTPQA